MKKRLLGIAILFLSVVMSFGSILLPLYSGDLEGIKEAVANGDDLNEIGLGDSTLQTPLLYAAIKAEYYPVYEEIARYLIEQGADVNRMDSEGLTALHYAARDSQLDLVRKLVEHGAEIDALPGEGAYDKGETPLLKACSRTYQSDRNYEIIRYLVEKGATLDKHPLAFQSPLTDTLYAKAINSSLYLIEQGADPNVLNRKGESPLFIVLDKNLDKSLVTALLEQGADPETGNNYGTLLREAVKNRQLDYAQMLIDAGADIRAVDAEGNTYLHISSSINSPKTLAFLIDKGLEVNVKNDAGDTPLHIAAENGYVDVVKALIDTGADLFALNNRGYSPMHIHLFVYEQDVEAVEWLLSMGVNANSDQNEEQVAPLHLAANNGDLQMVQLLVAMGADPRIKGYQGYTPLHTAVLRLNSEEQLAVIDYLLSLGVPVDIESDTGTTPLFEAILQESDPEIIAHLIDRGAIINHPDKSGKTIAHHAAEMSWGAEDVLDLFIAYGGDLSVRDNDERLAEEYADEETKDYMHNAVK
ncbi:MAG TPA: ankyrin repeat domain-containing protein [Thermotogota bacterium]|mgnify:FL=1|nr:ankyrin repeat domain-containing protein [Thermotogota bacterium]